MKVELPADTRISHYRILSRLGAGGMGEVYLAEDTRLDRKVAIKVLPGETLADDQAKKRLVRTLEINRDLAVARYFLGAAYLEKGQSEQAISELQKNRSRPVALGLLGYAYAVAGRKAEARKALAELQAISGRRYVSPYEIARIYVGLGEKEQAFEWLEKAYQGRSDLLTRLQVDPTLDSLRSDPRFADLVRRVGLEKH